MPFLHPPNLRQGIDLARPLGHLLELWAQLAAVRAKGEREEVEEAMTSDTLTGAFFCNRWVSFPIIVFLAVGYTGMVAIGAVAWTGQLVASRQADYLVSVEPSPLIAIRRYGDVIVAAEFNPDTNELHPTFLVLPVSGEGVTRRWQMRHFDNLKILSAHDEP